MTPFTLGRTSASRACSAPRRARCSRRCPFASATPTATRRGAAALRALFATGLFKDVRIEIEGQVAVVVVEERRSSAGRLHRHQRVRPRHADQRRSRTSASARASPSDKALADRAEQELKRQYLTRSLYGAEVVTTITPVDRNRVNVTFAVSEGGVARIREIRITRQRGLLRGTLLGQLDLTTGGMMTWYTKKATATRGPSSMPTWRPCALGT